MLNTIVNFLQEPLNIIFVVFCLFTIVQLFYIFRYYLLIPLHTSEFKAGKSHPVSVIICAKNEVKNLETNLPAILEQKYKDFEVIVVDDGSEDNTLEVLHNLKQKYKHLKFTSIAENNRFTHGKKLAVTVGVKAAKNEWLLFTDADCTPASEHWISEMQQAFTENTEIVLGYGAYRREKGLLNLVIRFDTIMVAVHYLSAALARIPYMGVGRNMAYRKSLFFKNKGFANHYHLLSGDDDLFVNQTATKYNTTVMLKPDTFTYSVPKKKFSEWLKQKRRHLTTGELYKQKHKFFLGLELASRYFFYGLFVFLMFHDTLWPFALGVFGLRVISYLVTFKIIMNRLKERDLLLPSLALEFILPIIYLFLSISNKITGKNNRWK